MKYDVIVAGGGTSGCACAYISAKYGLKTLLIEKNIHLGGAMTSALVFPVMMSGKNQINTEFFSALICELKKLGGQISYLDNSGWFNPEILKIALDNLLRSVGVDVLFASEIVHAEKINSHIASIRIKSDLLSEYNISIYSDNILTKNHDLLSEYIEAKYYIDATGNCEFARILNCEFLDTENKFQPASLRFIMSGVDNNAFAEWITEIDKDRDVATCEVIDGVTHFSTAYTWDTDKSWALAPYFDDAVAKGILKDADRNYFQVFSIAGTNGSVGFNCPRILRNLKNVDYFCLSDDLFEARQAIYRLANFCKQYFKGFENAYISNIADMLGIRVSRRIKGKYIYKKEDLISGKKFDNPVLISDYPIDIHSIKKDDSTLKKTAEYQLPIEALMSADYDNLFIAGRSLSADFEAQAALRVQASCFSMGEAVAKFIAQKLK